MRARPRLPLPLFVSLPSLPLLALLALGCGAASSPKSAEPPPANGGADEAADPMTEIDRGEWKITELFGPPAGARSDSSTQVSPTAAPAASASPEAPKQAPGQPMSGGEVSGGDACSIACTALASMERAARHVCEMSGPDEPRCTSARDRVRNANDRVAAHCTCGI